MADLTRERPHSNHGMEESLHFFQIIHADAIAEKKLEIPTEFVENFGHELPNVVTLILPNGDEWDIGLTKADGMTWLDDGWHEFVEYTSIRPGHFMVFKYERNSTFWVIIMDTSAYEVNYPSDDEELDNDENDQSSEMEEEEEGSSEVVDIEEEYYDNLNEKENEMCGSLKYLKMFDGKKLKINLQHGQTNPAAGDDEEIEIYVTSKFLDPSTDEFRDRAYRAVEMIKPKDPCFMIILHRSNFSSNNMTVPVGFVMDHWNGVVSNHIKVEDSYGRKWVIGVQREGRNCMHLREGCYEFWRDNDLKHGDICIFELRDTKAALHKVWIYRAD